MQLEVKLKASENVLSPILSMDTVNTHEQHTLIVGVVLTKEDIKQLKKGKTITIE